MTIRVRLAILSVAGAGLLVGSVRGSADGLARLPELDRGPQAREIAMLRMVIHRQRRQLDAYSANRAVIEGRAWGEMSAEERRLEMIARQDVVDQLAAEQVEHLRVRMAPIVREVREALDQARVFAAAPATSRDALVALEDRLYAIPTDGANDEILYRLSELRQAVGNLARRADELTDAQRHRLNSALDPSYFGGGTDPASVVESAALAVREFELAIQSAAFRTMAGLPWAVPMAR